MLKQHEQYEEMLRRPPSELGKGQEEEEVKGKKYKRSSSIISYHTRAFSPHKLFLPHKILLPLLRQGDSPQEIAIRQQ
jgi:hypothetical protein